MDFEILWNDDDISDRHEARVAIVEGRSLSTPTTASHQSQHQLVESFCLSAFYVVVSYDSIPIRSASVALSLPRALRSRGKQFSRPARVHYGFSISHPKQWSGAPQDAYFRCPTNDEYLFRADFDIHVCESNVLGLTFVFQLEDGSWLKDNRNKDFYVGGGSRKVPCTLEIPFTVAYNAEVDHGQMLSLYRTNPFWLQPSFDGDALHSCRQETQFILISLSTPPDSCRRNEQDHEKKFLALMPIIDRARGIRASIFGVAEGQYAGIRLETGRCEPLHISEVLHIKACIASFAEDPYDAIRCAVDYSVALVDSFSSRTNKISSTMWDPIISSERKGVLNSLGYCTWDAYGHDVNEKVATHALHWLSSEGISLGFVIIDDGWQAGGGAGPNYEHHEDSGASTGRPTLSSFRANEKFSHSLRILSQTCSVEVIAWVAIIGYWGGASGLHLDTKTFFTRGALSLGLHQNKAEDPAFWAKDYEVIYPSAEAVEKFFERYFVQSMASEQGVSGVKVDAQSILEILCNPKSPSTPHNAISRSSITANYRAAVTKAVERAFPNSVVINCMACGPETIFSSGRELTRGNVCWRTSNDHAFPGIEESAGSVSWHILCNAMTTLLLGEIFPVVDWDMFRASDRFAHIHALARVLSGGPIYFSDTTPFTNAHGKEAKVLLKSLITHDGRILRCQNPGRPTLDCLFTDPRLQPTKLFKVFNRTSVLGLIGLFNLDSSEESYDVSGFFEPADVEDFAKLQRECQYISLVTGSITRAFWHRSRHHRCEVSLPGMSAALVHICPIFRIAPQFRLAVLGQPRLVNAGAALASISVCDSVSPSESDKVSSRKPISVRGVVECTLLDYGETYLWLDEKSEECLERITLLNGQDIGYAPVQIDTIQLHKVDVPSRRPWGIRLHFVSGRG